MQVFYIKSHVWGFLPGIPIPQVVWDEIVFDHGTEQFHTVTLHLVSLRANLGTSPKPFRNWTQLRSLNSDVVTVTWRGPAVADARPSQHGPAARPAALLSSKLRSTWSNGSKSTGWCNDSAAEHNMQGSIPVTSGETLAERSGQHKVTVRGKGWTCAHVTNWVDGRGGTRLGLCSTICCLWRALLESEEGAYGKKSP